MMQSPALHCVTTRCVIVNITRWLKRVATQRNAKERKNRPGFYSSVVTHGLDATHRNAGPCVYCEPALSIHYAINFLSSMHFGSSCLIIIFITHPIVLFPVYSVWADDNQHSEQYVGPRQPAGHPTQDSGGTYVGLHFVYRPFPQKNSPLNVT